MSELTIDRPTTVISVRGRDRAALMRTPGFVYTGRRCAGWPASIWGNPFRPGDGVRPGDAVAEYVARVQAALDALRLESRPEPELQEVARIHRKEHAYWVRIAEALPLLRGSILGCWCLDWSPNDGDPSRPCHAIALSCLADARPIPNPAAQGSLFPAG